ncbi:MAG: nuclear transport factor 2 family protein [Gammaproteobacteria bacterium]
MSELDQEIAAVFKQAEDIWNTQDYAQLEQLWDTDDEEPFYLAEEQEDWVFGWEALRKYWVPKPGKRYVEAILMRYYNVHARLISPELALSSCWVRHDMKLKGPMKAWGGDARVSSVFRKKPEGWRFISYTEAHMSPLNYVRKLYEMNVSPEFEAFRQEVVAREAAAQVK